MGFEPIQDANDSEQSIPKERLAVKPYGVFIPGSPNSPATG
jgi:hypothetical protein